MTSRPKSRYACGAGASRARGCAPAGPRDGDSLEAIVDDYLANEAHDHAEEVLHYGTQRPSSRDAIWTAACSIEASGKLHSHQRRIGRERMRDAANLLVPHAHALAASVDFDALHDKVQELVGTLGRIGELAVYDIAERIGMHLGLAPRQIYLHSGTLEGARELLPSLRGKRLKLDALPPALRRLTAAQAENLLCIYKARLRALRRAGRLSIGA